MNRRSRILIVDDNPTNIDIMEEILGDDHLLETAACGEEALDIAPDFLPALILLDIIMPGIEGIETLTYLHARNPKMKIIAISGGGSIDASFHLRMAKRLGAFQTLGKPFTLRKLIETVTKTLNLDDVPDDRGAA